jgi:hypothetical protein
MSGSIAGAILTTGATPRRLAARMVPPFFGLAGGRAAIHFRSPTAVGASPTSTAETERRSCATASPPW